VPWVTWLLAFPFSSPFPFASPLAFPFGLPELPFPGSANAGAAVAARDKARTATAIATRAQMPLKSLVELGIT
jgi:hypothetical protein